MAYLEGAADRAPSAELAAMWAEDEQQWGFLPNFAKTFGMRPAAYAAWRALNAGIKESMGTRRYELADAGRGVGAALVVLRPRARPGARPPGPRQRGRHRDRAWLGRGAPRRRYRAVMVLARSVVRGADQVTEDDLAELRALGLRDDEILDVILAAAARCFFSKVLDASGTAPDSVFLDLDDGLRTALTVGRPIQTPLNTGRRGRPCALRRRRAPVRRASPRGAATTWNRASTGS